MIDEQTVRDVGQRVGHDPSAEDIRWSKSIDSSIGQINACAKSGDTAHHVSLDQQACADLMTLFDALYNAGRMSPP